MIKYLLNNKINFYIIFLFIFITSIFIRIEYLNKNFSHIDEVLSIEIILDEKSYNSMYLEKTETLYNPNQGGTGLKYSIFRFLDQLGVLKFLIQYNAVSVNTTQAPLQYFFLYFLLDDNQDFKTNLFFGRIISFLFGISFILYFFFFCKKYIFNEKNFYYSLIPPLFICFSYEHLLHSQYNLQYSLGFFAFLLMLHRLMYVIKSNYSHSYFSSLILLLICSTNYQFIPLLPCYYATIFFVYNYHKFNNIRLNIYKIFLLITESVLTLLLVVLFLLPFFSFAWSAITDDIEYIFLLTNNIGLFEKEGIPLLPESGKPLPNLNFFETINYIFSFFASNLYLVFLKMTSITSELSILHNLYGSVLLIFFIVGFFTSFKKAKSQKIYLLFFSFFFFILILLVINNKLALSPTRHHLILLLPITIFSTKGIEYLFDKINFTSKNLHKILTILIILSLYFIFFSGYKYEMEKRLSPYNEESLYNLLQNYNVSRVFAYGHFSEARLMQTIYREYPIHLSYHKWLIKYYNHNKGIFRNYITGKEFNTMGKVIQSDIDILEDSKKFENISLDINKNIVFISKHFPIDNKHISYLFSAYGIVNDIENLELIFKEEIYSDVEHEYSRLNNLGVNSLYIYIYKVLK